MSLKIKRQGIATALTDAGLGLKGYASPPNQPRIWDAWARWETSVAGDNPYALAFRDQWRVYIIVPADTDTADDWISDSLEQLLEVLHHHLAITGYQPARVTLDGSAAAYNALMITGESE